jgi:hypothetical protein
MLDSEHMMSPLGGDTAGNEVPIGSSIIRLVISYMTAPLTFSTF